MKLIALLAAGGASALYWLVAGIGTIGPNAYTTLWHLALAAFLGSLWLVGVVFAAADRSTRKPCAECVKLKTELTATREALATFHAYPVDTLF